MPTDTFCSDTLYVHTDPDSLPVLLKSAVSGVDHTYHKESAVIHEHMSGRNVYQRASAMAKVEA